jgi:hypothetical protein
MTCIFLYDRIGWQKWFASLLCGRAEGMYEDLVEMETNPEGVEDGRSTVLQLTISVVVLVICYHFETFSPDGLGNSPLRTPLGQLLTDTIDILEDTGTWNPDTVALTRVLLSSLIIRIGSQARFWAPDAQHAAWTSFFEVLATIEDFVFYSAVDAKVPIRPVAERHWKHLGLHVTSQGGCEDIGLVKKILDAVEKLRMHDMDENIIIDAAHRTLVKNLKKRVKKEKAFFIDSLCYFQDVEKQIASGKPGRDQTLLKKLSADLGKRNAKRVSSLFVLSPRAYVA